jgi:4-amino-4-deoxy-L-arabinose transferase-like glycosyltransferase
MRLLPRTFTGRLVVVAVVGVALRAAYLFVLARKTVGIGDWYFYHWQAQLIAQGRGFVDPWILLGTGQYRASAIHPPLYPLLLSGLYSLGGHSTLDQRSLGLFLGAITIVLVGFLGRRVGGQRVGIVAALLCAVYPLMIAVDGDLMSETLYGPLIAGMLLAAFAVLDRPTVRRALLLGALIGLASLTRSEALLFLPFLVLPVAWRARPSWRGRARVAIAAILSCVVVLAPWTIRNQIAFGRFVLVSTNDATVLAGANCDQTYHGTDMGTWSITCIANRTSTNEAVQAAIWRRQGLDYVSHHLTRLPVVMAVRLLRVWDLWQPRRQARSFAEGRLVGVEEAGVGTYYVLMLIGVVGVLALRRRRDNLLLVLLAPAVVVCVSTAVGYGVPRLRHSFEISLLVLAAAGIVAVQERVAVRRRVRVPQQFAASERSAV